MPFLYREYDHLIRTEIKITRPLHKPTEKRLCDTIEIAQIEQVKMS